VEILVICPRAELRKSIDVDMIQHQRGELTFRKLLTVLAERSARLNKLVMVERLGFAVIDSEGILRPIDEDEPVQAYAAFQTFYLQPVSMQVGGHLQGPPGTYNESSPVPLEDRSNRGGEGSFARVAVLIGLILVVFVVGLLVWSVDSEPTASPNASPTATSVAGPLSTRSSPLLGGAVPPQDTTTPPPLAAQDVSGVWEGSYVCSQGPTKLRLTINSTGAADGSDVTALFEFSALPSNPAVRSGSFNMTGTIQGNGLLDLIPGQWVQQPSGYVGVSLASTVSRSPQGTVTVINGTVRGSGCTNFSVSR